MAARVHRFGVQPGGRARANPEPPPWGSACRGETSSGSTPTSPTPRPVTRRPTPRSALPGSPLTSQQQKPGEARRDLGAQPGGRDGDRASSGTARPLGEGLRARPRARASVPRSRRPGGAKGIQLGHPARSSSWKISVRQGGTDSFPPPHSPCQGRQAGGSALHRVCPGASRASGANAGDSDPRTSRFIDILHPLQVLWVKRLKYEDLPSRDDSQFSLLVSWLLG
jgi:hypothetical protein